jgi:hypothetical protein
MGFLFSFCCTAMADLMAKHLIPAESQQCSLLGNRTMPRLSAMFEHVDTYDSAHHIPYLG